MEAGEKDAQSTHASLVESDYFFPFFACFFSRPSPPAESASYQTPPGRSCGMHEQYRDGVNSAIDM